MSRPRFRNGSTRSKNSIFNHQQPKSLRDDYGAVVFCKKKLSAKKKNSIKRTTPASLPMAGGSLRESDAHPKASGGGGTDVGRKIRRRPGRGGVGQTSDRPTLSDDPRRAKPIGGEFVPTDFSIFPVNAAAGQEAMPRPPRPSPGSLVPAQKPPRRRSENTSPRNFRNCN